MLFNHNNLETLVSGLNDVGIVCGDSYTVNVNILRNIELYNLNE